MKKFFKIFSLVALTTATISFVGCSKDDDPKDNDLFVGTYKGSVSYSSSDVNISTDEGSVTVVKIGDTYNFNFSNDIPSINGMKIEKGENHFEVSGWFQGSIIKIDENKLFIAMSKDGKTWGANCTR